MSIMAVHGENNSSPEVRHTGVERAARLQDKITVKVIPCARCRDKMRLTVRTMKGTGVLREYLAYRCNGRTCQTYKSIRRIIREFEDEKEGMRKCIERANVAITSDKYTDEQKAEMLQDADRAKLRLAAFENLRECVNRIPELREMTQKPVKRGERIFPQPRSSENTVFNALPVTDEERHRLHRITELARQLLTVQSLLKMQGVESQPPAVSFAKPTHSDPSEKPSTSKD